MHSMFLLAWSIVTLMGAVNFAREADCLPDEVLLVLQEEQERGLLSSCLSLQAVGGSTVILDLFWPHSW